MIEFVEVETAKQVFQIGLALLLGEHGLETIKVGQELSMMGHHLLYRLDSNLWLLNRLIQSRVSIDA